MHVAVKGNFSGLESSFHHELCVVVNRIKFRAAALPLSVQVDTHQGTAVVAYNNSVWVLHGHDLEYKGVSEVLGALRVADQEFYHPVHHPAGVGFARMNSACQDNALSDCYVHRVGSEVSYNKHVYVVSSQRLAEHGLPNFVFVGERAPRLDVLAQICVGVGIAVGKKHSVVIVRESYLKRERIVQGPVTTIVFGRALRRGRGGARGQRGVGCVRARRLLFFAGGLIIGNIDAVTIPTHVLFFSFSLAVNQRFHALVVI